MNNTPPCIDAVLFDLDGTLLDTAPDLVLALNLLLKSKGKDTVEFKDARNYVSQGAAALTRRGFPEVIDDDEFETLRQEFLTHYENSLCVNTSLFDGISEILATIESTKIPWGIVTNKPGWLTTPLLEQLCLISRTACVVSGDTLPVRKPHPDPLFLACENLNLNPRNTIYIGDDARDIYAGNAAGMYTCVAAYGYIDAELDTSQWGADFVINHPNELLNHIQLNNNAD